MAAYDYDLFVIGGGSGGVRAARLGAAKGLKTALAEEYRLGGTCVIRGCVPKKLYAYAAAFPQEFAASAGFGWQMPPPHFSWPVLRAAKDKEISRLSGLYAANAEKSEVEILPQRARLLGRQAIELADGRQASAKTILIATGARPFVPSFAGADLCLTSNEIFDLAELPKSIIIAGGGYIAVEFASILRGLGVEVTLVYRGERILRRFDGDLRLLLEQALAARGIKFIYNAVIEQVARPAGAACLQARLSDGSAHQAGQILLALGRRPNTAGLGLEKAGVKLKENGAVAVNSLLQTSAENIYALGDVIGRVELTPVAIHEAMCFVKTIAENSPTEPDYEAIPTAVFTEPELGAVGLTEEQAAAALPRLEVYRAHFRPLRNTISGDAGKMLLKLLVDGATQQVVGAHILGGPAAELAQLLAIAVKAKLTKQAFDTTMALHPSAAEELVTMYQPSYLYCDGKKQDNG